MHQGLQKFVNWRVSNMELVENLVLLAHVLAALGIIGLVLLQQGKGAEMGSGFGAGVSSTVFGSLGAGSFLARTTSIIALVFFVTSFSLAYFARDKVDLIKDIGIPSVEQINAAQAEKAEISLPDLEATSPAQTEGSAAESTASEAAEGDSELPDL
jgi:preprotein translocase subunit SecG